MKKILWFVLFIVVASAPPVLADKKGKQTEDKIRLCLEGGPELESDTIVAKCVGLYTEPCLKKDENTTTIAMSACYREEELSWDRLLNEYYLKIRGKLEKNKFELLRDVQKDWVKLKQKKCLLLRQLFNGSITQITTAQCTLKETARRTVELYVLLLELPSE